MKNLKHLPVILWVRARVAFGLAPLEARVDAMGDCTQVELCCLLRLSGRMVQRVLVFAQRKRDLSLANVGKLSNHARQQLLHHRKVAAPASFISDAEPSVQTLNQGEIVLVHRLRLIDNIAMAG